MANLIDYDVVVIGAGVSGLTTAMYASRSGLKTVVIEKGVYGGQLQNTGDIENYSGFGSVTGGELSEHMYKQAVEQGVEYQYGDVKGVTTLEDSNARFFAVSLKGKTQQLFAKTVVVATGVEHRLLGVDGEKDLSGRGVSYCALCDGNFFRNKDVAVIGGGDSALEESNYLTGIVDSVVLIHRRDEFRGQKVLQDRVLKNPKIDILFDSEVEAIHGDDKVDGLSIITKGENGSHKSFIEVDGVFVYVGMNPITKPFEDMGILNDEGYVVTDENMETSIEGLFAVGDVRDKSVRQIATAVGDGAIAGTSVGAHIDNLEDNQ